MAPDAAFTACLGVMTHPDNSWRLAHINLPPASQWGSEAAAFTLAPDRSIQLLAPQIPAPASGNQGCLSHPDVLEEYLRIFLAPQKNPAELYLHLNVSLCVRRPKWWIWTTNSSGKVHFLLNLSGRHPQHLIAGESHLREERISGCTSHLFASQKKRMEVDFSSSWIQLCLLLLHKQNQRVPGPRASLLSATVRNTSSRVKGSDSREIIQPLTDTLSC